MNVPKVGDYILVRTEYGDNVGQITKVSGKTLRYKYLGWSHLFRLSLDAPHYTGTQEQMIELRARLKESRDKYDADLDAAKTRQKDRDAAITSAYDRRPR